MVSKKKIFEIVDDDGRTTDSRAPNSAVHGQISWNSELNRDLMAVLVTWKNEEDLIKYNKFNAWTPFLHYKSMGSIHSFVLLRWGQKFQYLGVGHEIGL